MCIRNLWVYLRRLIFPSKKNEQRAEVFIHPNPNTFNSLQCPNFSLPSTLIHYISNNPISADGVLKLQKSCKFFFAKNKIIIVDRTVRNIGDLLFFCLTSSKQKFYLKDFPNIKFWLTYEVAYSEPIHLKISENIYCCTLQKLYIHNQELTINEIDFLLNGEKIIHLYLIEVNIRNENGNIVSCDQILAKVPNLLRLYYKCIKEIFTDETLLKMNKLKFNCKFDYFYFSVINEVDIKLLCQFFFKNADRNSKLIFGNYFHDSQNFQTALKDVVHQMLLEKRSQTQNICLLKRILSLF